MESQIFSAFINLGGIGLALWWLTLKLVPQLQKERSEAIAAFQSEMAAERSMHRELVDRVINANQHALQIVQEMAKAIR